MGWEFMADHGATAAPSLGELIRTATGFYLVASDVIDDGRDAYVMARRAERPETRLHPIKLAAVLEVRRRAMGRLPAMT
jgi:hypothetical protein